MMQSITIHIDLFSWHDGCCFIFFIFYCILFEYLTLLQGASMNLNKALGNFKWLINAGNKADFNNHKYCVNEYC